MRKVFKNDDWPVPKRLALHERNDSPHTIIVMGVLLALAGMLLGLVLASNPGTIAAVVLGGSMVILAIRYPVAALALAGATDVTCYYISGLTLYPPRIYLVTLVAATSIPQILLLLRNNILARKILQIFLAFFLISVLVDWAQGMAAETLLKDFLAGRMTPALIFLCCAAHARKKADFALLLGTILAATTLSSLIGIMQHHGIEAGWAARNALQAFSKTTAATNVIPGFESGEIRPMGLAGNTISFSYHLILAYAFVVPMLFFAKMSRFLQLLIAAMSLIFLIATIESLTRSALLGMAFVNLGVLWPRPGRIEFLKNPRLRKFVFFVVILGTTFGAIQGLSRAVDAERIYSYEDNTRISLYIGSIRMIGLYPLGVGGGNVQKIAARHSAEFLDLPTPTALMELSPHNGLLVVTVYWGLPMLAVVCYFFFLLFRFSRQLKDSERLMPDGFRWLGRMLALWLGAYLLHSSFHNGFPFTGDMMFWYYIGTFCALPNLVRGRAQEPTWVASNERRSAIA